MSPPKYLFYNLLLIDGQVFFSDGECLIDMGEWMMIRDHSFIIRKFEPLCLIQWIDP